MQLNALLNKINNFELKYLNLFSELKYYRCDKIYHIIKSLKGKRSNVYQKLNVSDILQENFLENYIINDEELFEELKIINKLNKYNIKLKDLFCKLIEEKDKIIISVIFCCLNLKYNNSIKNLWAKQKILENVNDLISSIFLVNSNDYSTLNYILIEFMNKFSQILNEKFTIENDEFILNELIEKILCNLYFNSINNDNNNQLIFILNGSNTNIKYEFNTKKIHNFFSNFRLFFIKNIQNNTYFFNFQNINKILYIFKYFRLSLSSKIEKKIKEFILNYDNFNLEKISYLLNYLIFFKLFDKNVSNKIFINIDKILNIFDPNFENNNYKLEIDLILHIYYNLKYYIIFNNDICDYKKQIIIHLEFVIIKNYEFINEKYYHKLLKCKKINNILFENYNFDFIFKYNIDIKNYLLPVSTSEFQNKFKKYFEHIFGIDNIIMNYNIYKYLYNVDFYIPNKRLIIEIDGPYHFFNFDYIIRDKLKNILIKKNYNLIRINYINWSHTDIDNHIEILTFGLFKYISKSLINSLLNKNKSYERKLYDSKILLEIRKCYDLYNKEKKKINSFESNFCKYIIKEF